MSAQFTLHRLAEFGDFIVYRRGSWARRERLPLFLVSRESDGRDLEEFRRKKSALKWAQAQAAQDSLPVVSIHDPRFPPMPHFANLP